MIRRLIAVSMVAVAIAAVACIDMSAPPGPASISVLILPSPSVVVGDTMRDSAGHVAPLTVQGFNSAGNSIQIQPTFFVTDTFRTASVGRASGILVGDSLGQAHVVAQIGTLQTNIATVPVSVAPETLFAQPLSNDTLTAPFSSDTGAAGRNSLRLGTTITGAGGTGAIGFIVHYTILSAPPSASSSQPAVFLASASGVPSSADTTDQSGNGGLNLTIQTVFLTQDPAFLAGQKTDTAIVVARSAYRGKELAGSPVTFIIPIKIGSALTP